MIPQRLSDYPWVEVNLSCKLCARRGRYRLARLAAKYGPEQLLDGVLADLASNCPYWRSNPRQYDPRCGARFEDLDRLRPADVPPKGAEPRQKAPARESIPSPPAQAATENVTRSPMLSGWTSPDIVVFCEKCGRREVFKTDAIRAATIGDVRLTDLRLSLTASCPKVQRQDFSDWCGAALIAGK